MAYSSIQKKKKMCAGCHTPQYIFSKGRCQGCATREKATTDRARREAEQTELDDWFEKVAEQIKADPHCWNCGAYVPPKYYRHATAHIFDKANFPSVATHPLNWLLLPAGCCHNKTHTLETFSKMKVFPEAIRRFKEFEHLITERHKYLQLFKSYIQ